MPSEVINILIMGKCEPRGSKIPIPQFDEIPWPPGYPPLIDARTGKPFVTPKRTKTGGPYIPVRDDNAKSGPWMRKVQRAAKAAMAGREPTTAPVKLTIDFYLERPQYHFGTGKNAGRLKAVFVNAEHKIRPDRLKLARAIEDALTGIVYADDAQTIDGPPRKHYVQPGELPRCEIQVEILEVAQVATVQRSLIEQ
jgi:hypothetical protein